ncbi:MAG: acetate--CoA ligase, partial [Magnetovibrio sp.]|nr:acetate--CoA ligase [Magnetovibrio sp.]
MSINKIYPVSDEMAKSAWVDNAKYEEMYKASIDDPETFWGEHGKRIDWIKPYTKVKDVSFAEEDLHIRWFYDGTLNVSANCLDRHLASRGDQAAIIWEGDEPTDDKTLTYRELYVEVCKFANVLKSQGIKKGDRVTIYMPMIVEAAVAMQACARIGAVHSVVFGGFSPDALAGRIQDCESNCIITADEGVRGGKIIPLKVNTDAALEKCPDCTTSIVVKRTGNPVNWIDGRDVWYHEAMEEASEDCPPEEMEAEDPLFILYTSGSTGKPKGVLHTTGGYLVYASMTHQYVFDYHDGDIYWCTADVGWVTGHSYILYGPLANGATTLMFEGVPNYPTVSRFWDVCDKHKVTLFYTAPTAIRALMQYGDEPVKATSRSTLRLLGSVGEPINPEAWRWYYEVVGDNRCPIVDTWWQTETGGILITPLPSATELKPGSATLPFFGITPVILDPD